MHANFDADSNVEISWRTFAGETGTLYYDLVRLRCRDAGLPLDEVSVDAQFRLHLHRGIAYLSALPIKSISEFVTILTN